MEKVLSRLPAGGFQPGAGSRTGSATRHQTMNPASLYLYFSLFYFADAVFQGWLFLRTGKRLSLWFSLLLAGNFYIYLYYGLFYLDLIENVDALVGTSLVAQFANIFSGYYLIYFLLYPEDRFPWKSLIVHTPLYLALSAMLLQLRDRPFRLLILKESHARFLPDYYSDGPVRYLFVIYVALVLGLLLFMAARRLQWKTILKEVFQRGAVRDIASIAFLLVGVYSILFLALTVSQEAGQMLLANILLVLEMTAFTAGMVLLQLLPRLLKDRFQSYHVSSEEARKHYIRDRLQNVDLSLLESRLGQLMNEEKIYCDEDLDLRRLAALAGVSYRQLSEYLNAHQRQSFQEYLQAQRIRHAKHLLRTAPDLSVTRIAFDSGFNSLASFYRAFKRQEGKNPLKFREENDSQVTT